LRVGLGAGSRWTTIVINRKGLDNMSKFLIGILATASLVACVDSGSDSQSQDNRYTVGDRTVRIDEGNKDSDQQGFAPAPTATTSACRVVLEWCTEPGTGDSVCTATGCTLERAVDACLSLIDSTCGFN
jgi:hypothetical protein